MWQRPVNGLMCGKLNDFQNNKFWYFFLQILVDADADASLFFWGSRKEQKQNLNPGQSTGWVAVKRSANTSITLTIVLANNNANENVKAGSNQRHAHLKVKNRFKIKAHKKIQVSSWVYKKISHKMIAFTESLFFSSEPYIEYMDETIVLAHRICRDLLVFCLLQLETETNAHRIGCTIVCIIYKNIMSRSVKKNIKILIFTTAISNVYQCSSMF